MPTPIFQLIPSYMNVRLCLLALFMCALPHNTAACERPNHRQVESYFDIVSELFEEGFDRSVELRIIALPAFGRELFVGIRTFGDRYETFTLTPAIPIKQFVQLREYENGESTTTGPDGAVIEMEDDQIYRYLIETTPEEYREINIDQCSRVIESFAAHRVIQAWKTALPMLNRSKLRELEIDGATFMISIVNKDTKSADAFEYFGNGGSQHKLIESFTNSLSGFCKGKVGENALLNESDLLIKLQPSKGEPGHP